MAKAKLLRTISDESLKAVRLVLVNEGKIAACRLLMKAEKCSLRDAKDLADHLEAIGG